MIGEGETKTRKRTNVIWRQYWKWWSTVFVISHTLSSPLLYNFNVVSIFDHHWTFCFEKSLTRDSRPCFSSGSQLGQSPLCTDGCSKAPCAYGETGFSPQTIHHSCHFLRVVSAEDFTQIKQVLSQNLICPLRDGSGYQSEWTFEKIQTAFDPPNHRQIIILQICFRKRPKKNLLV